MQRILSHMQSTLGSYRPTFWAHGNYAQLGLLVLWGKIRGAAEFKRHVINCEDGGEVAVEEYIPPHGSEELPQEAPVVLIMHTIAGKAQDESEFCKYAYSRGMRPIVLSRRGHFSPLVTPKFNFMGCTNDTTLMVKYVEKMYPDSFLGAVGFSAGSGQVVSYIGRQNDIGPVRAAVSLCPAYDMKDAFSNFDEKSPLLAKYLLMGLKKFFLHTNFDVLNQSLQYEDAVGSTSVQELFETSVHMAGFGSFEEYLEDSNPLRHYHMNKVPCLVLNALDDPLCVEKNIRLDIAEDVENFALILTKSGSHVAYKEGLLGESCYMHRLAIDFLHSARLELEQHP
eukprot:CFRG5848T1